MTRIGRIRLVVILGAIGALELACRTGMIDRRVVMPPSEMVATLAGILASGSINADIVRTLGVDSDRSRHRRRARLRASASSIHALPRVRQALDPLLATYYAVPIFIFYPVLVAIFGLSIVPIVLIGVATAVVAMIIATLNGLDRVPRVLDQGRARASHGPARDRACACSCRRRRPICSPASSSRSATASSP